MTLQDLVGRIVWSSPNDWNKIRGHPSYREKFTLHQAGGGDRFGSSGPASRRGRCVQTRSFDHDGMGIGR